jgi:mRNA-degrading endonuclease HigB of HigAB toxin-antitoxin module
MRTTIGSGQAIARHQPQKMLLATREHADLGEPLDAWYRIVKRARWRHLTDVRQVFPSADAVGQFTVLNIKGNMYRIAGTILLECPSVVRLATEQSNSR